MKVKSRSGLTPRLQILASSIILCCLLCMSFDNVLDLGTSTKSYLVAQAFSLNKTISEKGLALQYSSHIDEWDPDNKTAGTPVIYGLLYLLSPDETMDVNISSNSSITQNLTDVNVDNSETTVEHMHVQPQWTRDKSIRVCMQYWDESAKGSSNFTVNQMRWVLNFTFPMKFANWTPQFSQTDTPLTDATITDWCSRSANWGGVYQINGNTKSKNQRLGINVTKLQPNYDEDEEEETSGRLLRQNQEMDKPQKKVEEKLLADYNQGVKSRLLQNSNAEAAAQAPQAGDTGPTDDSDDAIARAEADAEAIEQAKKTTGQAPLPDPLFGVIQTLSQSCDLGIQEANVSFQFPFVTPDQEFMMDIDWENSTMKILLNWGIYDDEDDTDPDALYGLSKVFGARSMRDAMDWKFLKPKSSLQSALIYTSVFVIALSVSVF